MKYRKMFRSSPRGLFPIAAGLALSLLTLEELAQSQNVADFSQHYLAGVTVAGGISGIGGNSTQACSRLLGFIEGGFGALIATAAGIGVIISAAAGGFRTAWCLLVVSVGSFILRSYLTLFHPVCR